MPGSVRLAPIVSMARATGTSQATRNQRLIRKETPKGSFTGSFVDLLLDKEGNRHGNEHVDQTENQ